jgi:hypothetical protein
MQELNVEFPELPGSDVEEKIKDIMGDYADSAGTWLASETPQRDMQWDVDNLSDSEVTERVTAIRNVLREKGWDKDTADVWITDIEDEEEDEGDE